MNKKQKTIAAINALPDVLSYTKEDFLRLVEEGNHELLRLGVSFYISGYMDHMQFHSKEVEDAIDAVVRAVSE